MTTRNLRLEDRLDPGLKPHLCIRKTIEYSAIAGSND